MISAILKDFQVLTKAAILAARANNEPIMLGPKHWAIGKYQIKKQGSFWVLKSEDKDWQFNFLGYAKVAAPLTDYDREKFYQADQRLASAQFDYLAYKRKRNKNIGNPEIIKTRLEDSYRRYSALLSQAESLWLAAK